MEKVCFVVQRYGTEINGGAETLCRFLAEKLSVYYNVEIFTTCAIDSITWKNEYTPDTEEMDGILVHRFSSESERRAELFDSLGSKLFSNQIHTEEEELEWILAQGPVCPSLLEKLKKCYKEYKAVIFMTYLYYPTAVGLRMGFENALFIPTLHDEPPAHFGYYQKVFMSAKGIIWNTHAEKRLAEELFQGIDDIPAIIAGAGVDLPPDELPAIPNLLNKCDYIIYAGRIESAKGCKQLFNDFYAYKREYKRDIKLVVIGKEIVKVPEDDSVIYLGFVSDEEKFSLISHSKALVLFSENESLSMVVLEAMSLGKPVLVNGHCEVLKDHCILSNAGLYFYNYREFAEELEYLFLHDDVYREMCSNGISYVRKNYQWSIIVEKIRGLIEQVNGDG